MGVKIKLINFILFGVALFIVGCNNNEKEKQTASVPATDTVQPVEPAEPPQRGPVINITDTLSLKRLVLIIKDSAATMDRVGMKLQEIYGTRLDEIIQKNKIKVTGSPMAWYKTEKAPYFFEAGLPVDKKPAKLPRGVFVKEIGVDSVVVGHFYGPYELLPQAYEALRDWLKDRKKTIKGTPYEIYVGDPMDAEGKPRDPYKVQTDVVFHWK